MTKYKRLPRKLKKGIRSLRSCRPRSKWQRKAYNRFFKTVKTLAEIERLHQNFLESLPSAGLVVAAACDRNFPKGKGKIGCINPLSAPGIIELPGEIVLNCPEIVRLEHIINDTPVIDSIAKTTASQITDAFKLRISEILMEKFNKK